jgi:hypothetical protein
MDVTSEHVIEDPDAHKLQTVFASRDNILEDQCCCDCFVAAALRFFVTPAVYGVCNAYFLIIIF